MKYLIYLPTFTFLFLFNILSHANEDLSLREIYVITDVVSPGEIISGEIISSSSLRQQFKQDTSSLLEQFTGIDNAANGSVSSIPYMHGLNDDRIRISVDGVDLNSACTSHTDTDLSFIDINDVDFIKVFAGITPVSMGGDSIAGSIQIKTKTPTFSKDDQLIYSNKIKSFYKSNNDEQGIHLQSTVASSNAYLKYSGSYSQSNNYSSAKDFKGINYGGTSDKAGIRDDEIASSGYRMENHKLSYGYQIDNHLLEIKFDYQNIPFQGFMNQRMDVVGQHSHKIQFKDTISFSWGSVELMAYHHQVETKMNFGKNKNFIYSSMMGTARGMSMTHHGYTTGFNAISDIYINNKSTIRSGIETQFYEVDDTWNPTGGMMSPNVMKNINDGKRDRYSLFTEIDYQWSKEWFTQTGIRLTRVEMNTNDVQGYNNMGYGSDANTFNASDRKKDDDHLDLSLSAAYSPNLNQTHEFGYSLKNRSPTLQERYLWSSNAMAASMANWFGDGNGYVGDVNLDKETAHTFAYAAIFHDVEKKSWNINFKPYITYIDNYIDAVSFTSRADGFRTLTLGNQNARIWGFDMKTSQYLGNIANLGDFYFDSKLSHVKGINTEADDDLYHVMPTNLKLIFSQKINQWKNGIHIQFVNSKKNINETRQEMETSGYALVDLKSSYQKENLQLNIGIYNLFDRDYNHPLGGVYMGQGKTMNTSGMGLTYANAVNVPGMGRSIFSSVEYSF